MREIALFNCYWCKCAYCIYKLETECFNRCLRCAERKDFKMPYRCDRFVEDTAENRKLVKEVQKCIKCRYKRFYHKVKKEL
jgi:hypothetical protein